MSREALGRSKQPGCLSAWQVSQLALGLADVGVVEHRHSCAVCAQLAQAEEKQREAAVYERVPSQLLNRSGKRNMLRRVHLPRRYLVAAAVSLAALGGASVAWRRLRTPPSQPSLVAQVSRDGRVLQQEIAPRKVGKLRPGDKVRLRVLDPKAHWVRLEAQQGGTLWDVYYEGSKPEDGWLPAGFTVTPVNRMSLRLLSCPQEPAIGSPAVPAECFVEQIDL